MLDDLKNSYCGVGGIFARYWRAYGGWKAVLTSPYLHASVVLTFVLAHLWVGAEWWSDPIAILPGMVGFAIGAYAIVLGFGDERFREIIMTRRNGKTSPYVRISASLAHFIVVQLGALVIAICAKGLNFPLDEGKGIGRVLFAIFGDVSFVHEWVSPVGYFFGFLLYVYALATALATAMAIFRLTTMTERDEEPKNGRN
ncbi:hypothetical protein NCW_01109 [Burkholderia pseudomallei]|uniref:hypothetical protein n=1 Tax=Burkholderia pseudomallei TaxID=28450 RepID=UPI00050F569D|nr:hypothetical protein [Burkholderia pseudomallei]KGD48876.1 hypothetical protein DP43_2030 [Burkholderia pseudomallei]KGS37244.1 hypothetical protein X945_1450 [Burkholderia pseudomallei ABCPW 107]